VKTINKKMMKPL